MDLMVSPTGQVRAIYAEVIDLASLGAVAIQRASAVEPDGRGGWQVDLTPVIGPVCTGFATRSRALAFEHDWLTRHWLPCPAAQ